jgi:3-oxoacyl-[acyl-carrier protein] reductase
VPVDTGLQGKGVLVTGGAGGIGRAVVRAFAQEGALVAIHYNTSKEQARQLAQETGGAAIRADLTLEPEADALVPAALNALGRLDILVANAGCWPSAGEPVSKMSWQRWQDTIAANLHSTFLSCRAFLRHVERTRSGSIVITGSTAGLIGEGGHADYAAAKSAVMYGLTKSLKNEIVRIAARGRVNAVCPGWTATDMTRDAVDDPDFTERITRTMALRKLARADDVARVIVALASDEICGHVTGEVITVAGGMEGRVLHEE